MANTPKWPASLTAAERVAVAQTRLPKIVDSLLVLIHLHESNRIISYSDQLSSQIPRSYAGHAFVLFQRTMLKAEAMRLCTLWDATKRDTNSLPTIADLIDDDAVLAEIRVQSLAQGERHFSAQDDDPELLAWMKDMSHRAAEKNVAEREGALRKAVADIRTIRRSDTLTAVRQFRNMNIAHSLDDKAKKHPDLPYKLGYERQLLERTIPIVDDLYLGVCQTGFMWDDSRKLAQKYAKALWHGCRFEVLE